MKKIMALLAIVLLGTTSMMAQERIKNETKFGAELGIGSELELGLRGELQLNDYLSWDILHAKYARDWQKNWSFNELSLTTGVRAYSPEFGPDLKAFGALDLGYGLMFKGGSGSTSCFALDFTLGIQINEHWYAGYGFGMMSHDGAHKDHLLRVGYCF